MNKGQNAQMLKKPESILKAVRSGAGPELVGRKEREAF